MPERIQTVVAVIISVAFAGCANSNDGNSPGSPFQFHAETGTLSIGLEHRVSLASLPRLNWEEYRVDPYIKAAGQLQAMGKEAAFKELLSYAHAFPELDDRQRIAVLCRMLFTQRPGGDFERPHVGTPVFLGENQRRAASFDDPSFKKWPLEPIEIVDGVPFAIVVAYAYEGLMDPTVNESYVRYCMTNCDWSSTHFATKSSQQKEAAMRKLLASPKCEHLEDWEKEYLLKQIK
jgi:hypothetical protein